MREELQAVNKQRDALRAKVRELRGQVGTYSSVQKIDERVAGLEYHITHHTLALREENRVSCSASLKPVACKCPKPGRS